MVRIPVDTKIGEDLCVVFKGQHAFVPQANPQRQSMEMVLNVIHGTFRGFVVDGNDLNKNVGIMFETESHTGVHVIWTIDGDDILMVGRKIEGANIARVQ